MVPWPVDFPRLKKKLVGASISLADKRRPLTSAPLAWSGRKEPTRLIDVPSCSGVSASEGSGRGLTDSGEFIYRDHVVKGSHLLDELKHLTSSFKKPHNAPLRWNNFLNLLADLNVPSSMIHHKQCARTVAASQK